MCLGIPAQLVAGDIGHPDLAMVCDRLTQRQLRRLRGFTLRHLDMVNHRVEHSGPLAVLG